MNGGEAEVETAVQARRGQLHLQALDDGGGPGLLLLEVVAARYSQAGLGVGSSPRLT